MIWILLTAVCSFVSFGWAMRFHFQRNGRYTSGMKLTATAGALSCAIHLTGLVIHLRGEYWPALILYGIATALFWSAVSVTANAGLAACYQGRVATRVVDAGPYRWIRHPFYTAYGLAWVAGSVATHWWPAIVSAACMIGLYVKAARAEEREWLGSPNWEQYASYMQRTGRLQLDFRTWWFRWSQSDAGTGRAREGVEKTDTHETTP